MTGSSNLSPVIVTGGCGFLGSHLVETLLKDHKCQVHVIDVNTEHRIPGAIYQTCDITSAEDVELVFLQTKPKTVFHVVSPDPLSHDNAKFRRVNVEGTHNLLSAARAAHTQAFIYTSTSSVIHNHVSDMLDGDESWPILRYPAQKNVYTLTKVEAEDKVRAANRARGDSSMLTAIIRPASVFGERDYLNFFSVVNKARAGRANVQIGSGQNLFSYSYVGNLADAHILAAEALIRAFGKPPPPPESRVDGEAFFITNDEDMRFWDYQRAGAAAVGYPVKKEDIKVIPLGVALAMGFFAEWAVWIMSLGRKQSVLSRQTVRYACINRTLTCDKAKRILGYKPKIYMAEAIEKTGDWFVQEAKRDEQSKKAV
ncbi:erg26, C-3 sterol dehydrogenase [Gnomoniopsis sp. IMI 355080]|nr:erg26, C-3 sterol dehydrogenase [Gnomoniopsis sp. IMI 355080]